MSRQVRLRVNTPLEYGWHVPQDAEVVIDREVGTITVRPLRSRRSYTMTLASVAQWVVRQHLVAGAKVKP